MTRRPAHIPKRKAFSASVKRAVQERSGGICEKLGCDEPAVEIDHGLPVALGGPSTLGNAFHLCRACHQKKSALDVKMIAKSDRQGGRSGQQARRKRNGSTFWKPPGYVSPLNSKSKFYRKRKVGA